ncbi:MAG: leucine-rich repeat domain-containing protein [Mycoplasma sp.]
MKKDNEDIKSEEILEEIESTEETVEVSEEPNTDTDTENSEDQTEGEEQEPKKKGKEILWICLILLLFVGISLGAAGATGIFNATENVVVPSKATTIVVKESTESLSFEEIETGLLIDPTSKEVSKDNLEKYFIITNSVNDAIYTVEELSQNSKIKAEFEIKDATIVIKASKVLNKEGTEDKTGAKEFKIQFKTRELVNKTTTIENGTFDGTLDEFKSAINYTTTPVTITNIEDYFKINNAFDGAEYLLTIQPQTKKIETSISIEATKSYLNSEIVDGQTFNVKLITNDEPSIVDGMFSITKSGILSIVDGWKETEDGKELDRTGELKIPVEVKGIVVKEIISGSQDKYFVKQIKNILLKLTFPSGSKIEKIGDYAFNSCFKLVGNLNLSGLTNLKTIGNYAFNECYALNGNLNLSGLTNLTSIGEYAFSGCSSLLGSLNLSGLTNLTSIGKSAFIYCAKLSGDLIIPNLVKKIGQSAFSGCIGLKGTLTIGNSVVEIADMAFQNCINLTGNIIIPESVESIGGHAFAKIVAGDNAYNGSIVIGNSVKTIGEYAFSGCGKMSGTLTIGKSVETIGRSAFSECKFLKGDLEIGDSVTTIGSNAFYGCIFLTGDLIIPDSVIEIGITAFRDCDKITSISVRQELYDKQEWKSGYNGIIINLDA